MPLSGVLCGLIIVALRKESVDRNRACTTTITICIAVALRKESVDRNASCRYVRRVEPFVALRKESVDRNRFFWYRLGARVSSLSARRAWIEIIDYIIDYVNDAVALRKESVDRNFADVSLDYKEVRRSPQGERG